MKNKEKIVKFVKEVIGFIIVGIVFFVVKGLL